MIESISLDFTRLDSPQDIEDIIFNSLQTPDSFKGINYLSVGSSTFPFSKSSIINFVLSFGLDEDSVISNVSKSIGIRMFNENDFTKSSIIGNHHDIVVSGEGLFSKDPIKLKQLFDAGALPKIQEVGGITNSMLTSLPDFFGHEMHHPEIIFRKILQDIVLYAFERRAKNVSIFYKNNTFTTIVSASLYSTSKPAPFHKKSVFIEFVSFLKTMSLKSDTNNDIIYFELNGRKVSIVVEANTSDFSVTFELYYKSAFRNTAFNNYNLPELSTLFSGINVICFTNKSLDGFILSQLKSTISYGEKKNALFLYDSPVDMSIFPFKLSMNDLNNNTLKLGQADIIICSISNTSSFTKIQEIANTAVPLVILWQAQNPISALKKIIAIDPFIANQLKTISQLYLHPSLCQYCSSTKILNQPIKISHPHHPITYINDGTSVNTRNHAGCNKCSFGISSETCFGDILSISPHLIKTICNVDSIEYDILQKLNRHEYRDCMYDKVGDITDMLIDPNDMATF
jgi:hypothetical protein